MTYAEALLSHPAIQRLFADKPERLYGVLIHLREEETKRETVRDLVCRILNKRFGPISEELAGQVDAIQEQQKLDDLFDLALGCPDLEAFRMALGPS